MTVDFVRYGADAVEGCSPEAIAFLTERGVPREVITIFRAAPQPVRMSATLNGREVGGTVIGLSREDDEIFLEDDTGRVFLLASWGPGKAILVNDSIQAFVESLVMVQSRYPFYPPGSDLDTAEHAEESLRESLEKVDETATADPDGFWSAFLDDVAIGDYSG